MSNERIHGYIRKLSFKRTWGILMDQNEEEYIFDVKDIDRDAFALSEGTPVTFRRIDEINQPANTRYRALDVRVKNREV